MFFISLGLRETLAAQEDCLSKLMKKEYHDDDEICSYKYTVSSLRVSKLLPLTQ